MTYRWEYICYQHDPFYGQVIKCSVRSYLNRADALADALQKASILSLDGQVVLLLIKENEATATSPMSNYQIRLATFRSWPPAIPLTGESLAKAGFYYEGTSDRVTCYSCDKSLKSWLPTDNAWIEHYRHSPKCAHLHSHLPKDYDEIFKTIFGTFEQQQNNHEVCDCCEVLTDVDTE